MNGFENCLLERKMVQSIFRTEGHNEYVDFISRFMFILMSITKHLGRCAIGLSSVYCTVKDCFLLDHNFRLNCHVS